MTSDDTPTPDDWLFQGSTDVEEVAGIYDDWAEGYDADLDDWSYAAPGVVAGIVVDQAAGARSILDAGCGTGLVGVALRSAGFEDEIHGVDVSETSLEVAARTDAYTSLAPADLQRPLERADGAFDALVCVGVMTYVPDVEAAWREFVRVVRPGGLVVVTQREDLWEPRDCQGVIDRLSAEGLWEPLDVTDPQPYLPGNPDGMSNVGVRYVTARAR